MDLRKLKTLIDLVSDSNISELEITEAEGKVRIVKASPQAAAMPMVLAAAPVAATAAVPGAAAVAPVVVEDPGHVVTSPMVGTFYRSGSPGAKPFADLGDQVKPGDPICIIEAMKIMNEIECDYTGKVRKILAVDGQAVEYGQPLFIID